MKSVLLLMMIIILIKQCEINKSSKNEHISYRKYFDIFKLISNNNDTFSDMTQFCKAH